MASWERLRSAQLPIRTGSQEAASTPTIALVSVAEMASAAPPSSTRGTPTERYIRLSGSQRRSPWSTPAWPPMTVTGTTHSPSSTAGSSPSRRSSHQTAGEAATASAPRTRAARQVVVSTVCSIAATSSGAAAIRRAAVAWRPSCTTDSTMSSAIRPATAPYWLGPSRRAATIWNA